MITELKGAIRERFVEERTRTEGVYKLQDGDTVFESSLAGQLSAVENPHQRIAEFQATERRVKPFGVWKRILASEPVWLNTQNEK